MTFKYSTDVKEFKPIPAGNYHSQVVNCQEKISSKGNQMLVIDFDIFCGDGSTRRLSLYLTEKMNWMLKRFWEAVGKPEKFNGECEAYELTGECPTVSVDSVKETYTDEATGKIKTVHKNVINGFIMKEEKKEEKNDVFIDDEFTL